MKKYEKDDGLDKNSNNTYFYFLYNIYIFI